MKVLFTCVVVVVVGVHGSCFHHELRQTRSNVFFKDPGNHEPQKLTGRKTREEEQVVCASRLDPNIPPSAQK